MSKKVVVITGSPRKNGNSFAMTDAFIKAAEAKGHCSDRLLRGRGYVSAGRCAYSHGAHSCSE